MPSLARIDHVHLYAEDRISAAEWYGRVLGLKPAQELAGWATEEGPLFLRNGDGTVAVALFQRPPKTTRATVAFRAGGKEFLEWRAHFKKCEVPTSLEDHDLSWSIYFEGPDGAPFEITSYDYEWVKARL